MKKLKWITVVQYVEEETGLLLSKWQIESKQYLIINKIENYETRYKYIANRRQEFNVRTIVYECTGKGRQLSIFGDNQ